MAQVFEGEHVKLGQLVAIKVLRDELCRDPSLVERFEREGRALSKLKSRHVVRVFDVDVAASGAPFLVMERLEGSDLETELQVKGQLSVAEAVSYLRQACAAMAEAHRIGIVHRDLKPSNLFLAKEGDAQVLKVLDFGIVKDAPGSDVRLTSTQTTMGTPLYMAPEQFRSAKEVDARADVWALGATLYELLSGTPPFVGSATTIGVSVVTDPLPPIEATRSDLPAGLRAVIEKALEKDPARRFPSAKELGEALGPWDDAALVPASLGNVVLAGPPSSVGKHPAVVALESAHTLHDVTAVDSRPPSVKVATQLLPAGVRTREATAARTQEPVGPPPPAPPRARWVIAAPLVLVALGVGAFLALRPTSAPTVQPDTHAAPTSSPAASLPGSSAPLTPAPSATPAPSSSVALVPVGASSLSSSTASTRPATAPLRSIAPRPSAVPSPSTTHAPLFFPQ